MKPYKIRSYNQLKNRSISGDQLDTHDAVKKRPESQAVKNYNNKSAIAIAILKVEHTAIGIIKVVFNITARDTIAKDIQDLWKYTRSPKSALKEIIERHKKLFPL